MNCLINSVELGALLGLVFELTPLILITSFTIGLFIGVVGGWIARGPSKEDREFWNEVRSSMQKKSC